MALRGKKPEAIEKRLKALFFGPSGSTKTTVAIQFPRPYLIDTEKGAENKEYVDLLKKAGGLYWFTTDPDELIAEVVTLIKEPHDLRTLIIDPMTIIYNDLLDKAADEVGTDFGKHKGPADRKIKHLLTLLLRLDMNVIITSHAKPKWIRTKDAKGKDTVVEDGQTFDCYGRLDYLFDLVFEVQKRGKERVGIIRKTRMKSFPDGETFPFCYDEIADRYGRDILERQAVTVELATPEMVADITRLLADRVGGKELAEKWLEKAGAENFGEMPSEAVAKCIDFLRSPRVEPVGAGA